MIQEEMIKLGQGNLSNPEKFNIISILAEIMEDFKKIQYNTEEIELLGNLFLKTSSKLEKTESSKEVILLIKEERDRFKQIGLRD